MGAPPFRSPVGCRGWWCSRCHLVLQVHQPDDGAAVGVALLLILLGALLPQLLLIIGRLTPEVKDNERASLSSVKMRCALAAAHTFEDEGIATLGGPP